MGILKLSRILNNGNKKNNKLFYSTGHVNNSLPNIAVSLIPSGSGSMTLRHQSFVIGTIYQILAFGTCDWNDYKSLKIAVKDSIGMHEIVSINIPLSQCDNIWYFEFDIIVSGLSEITTNGYFRYVRTNGTIFESSNIGGVYTSNQDITIDFLCSLTNGQIRCNVCSLMKIS